MSTATVEEALSYLGYNATKEAPDESVLENHTTMEFLLANRASDNCMSNSEYQTMTLSIMVDYHNSGLRPQPLMLCLSDDLQAITKACEEAFGHPDTPVANIYVRWAMDGGLNRLVGPFKLNDRNTATTLRLLKDRKAVDVLEINSPCDRDDPIDNEPEWPEWEMSATVQADD